jgi:hypothetical protein
MIWGFEGWCKTAVPQCELQTEHLFHGGMYARTIRIPSGVVLTGALIKIPTLLILNGYAEILTGENEWAQINGYGVIPGSAGRKQVIITRGPVEMTMLFPTQAKTVEEAEREFTDEWEKLMSRNSHSDILQVTGE